MKVNGDADGLGCYELGATPLFACAADPRFSYCLYIPRHFSIDAAARYSLVVLVHGTGRNPVRYRDEAAEFAESQRCIVLCPLFPAGIPTPRETENYKFLSFRGIRFDLILLQMIAEVAAIYRIDAARFCLFGFSGGAHFAHRFLYVHPERLRAVSIDAPGVVTLLDERKAWWCGVGGLANVFGKALQLDAIRAVPVQTLIGRDDLETWEIATGPGSPFWMEGITDSGANRVERLASLRDSLRAAGVSVEHLEVPGVAHRSLLAPALEFFARVLQARH